MARSLDSSIALAAYLGHGRFAGGTPTLDKRMKKLIQQLGEAIHESVSESEQIAGVVQDIRRHGFDVLLMLEATIGLNEVEQQPSAVRDASKPDVDGEASASADKAGFTTQDLKFLRSLRISMQGDEFAGPETEDNA